MPTLSPSGSMDLGSSPNALPSDLERVLTLPSGPQFPQGEAGWGVGEMLRSLESLRFSLPGSPHPPPQAPGSPGACWEPRPGLPARLVGGGASSLPLPPHLGLTLAPAGGSGRLGRREGGREPGPQARLRPPPPPFLLRPLPASPPPPQQVATPARGPISNHPHPTPSSRPGSELRGGGREGRRKRGETEREKMGEGREERPGREGRRKRERERDRRGGKGGWGKEAGRGEQGGREAGPRKREERVREERETEIVGERRRGSGRMRDKAGEGGRMKDRRRGGRGMRRKEREEQGRGRGRPQDSEPCRGGRAADSGSDGKVPAENGGIGEGRVRKKRQGEK